MVVALMVVASKLCAGAAPSTNEISQSTLKAGSLSLHRCATAAPWCGELVRPLDPAGIKAGTISIYFEYYPHIAAGNSTGTLVATEGGPGFPATESRESYLDLFGPLRSTRDVVLMDNRGTGRSGAIDCVPLQTDPTLTEENVARCGSALGPQAALYGAVFAADDLAAILTALGSRPIDLYGDSYGTFFEQVFAVRHADQLRSIILDGAYPLDGQDYAWYPNYAPAMRAKFNLACERSADCSRLEGSSMDHIAPALKQLRRAPIEAQARDGDGKLRTFRADATQLATVMFGSAPAYASVRELDAAARAFMVGDTAPLLRLMAETQVEVDSRDATQAPSNFSLGLAAAAMCQDAPQIYDMSLDPGRRIASRDAAIAERKRVAANTYAPFTIDEYRGMPLDYAFIDECARWPAVPSHLDSAPGRGTSARDLRDTNYPDVPALVISGDLDNMTPLADGTLVAKKFPHAQQLIVPNGFHVNALPHSRSGCPASITRHFIESLDAGDTTCVRSVPEVRLVPAFARQVDELAPARALEGNAANEAQLRAVTGAMLTVGDAIARIESNTTGQGAGLRGGTFRVEASGRGSRLTLHDLRWTEDLGVSGTVMWPGRSGAVLANIVITDASGSKGSLRIRWTEGAAHARALVRGRIGNKAVVAETSAP